MVRTRILAGMANLSPLIRPQPAPRMIAVAGGEGAMAGNGPALDASYLLGLLAQARHALGTDLPRAHDCLDHACRVLQRVQPEIPAAPVPVAPLASKRTGGLAGWQVRKVTAHVEQRLGEALPTEELAQVAGLSPGHFSRAFKVSMGETPHAYIVRQRIMRAQRMMLDTADSLSAIAMACGLTDQAHLTRLFKRFVGTTPLVWRRTWQDAAAAE